MKEMTRREFELLAKEHDWEVYSQRQVYQFSQDLLKSEDPIERERGAIDFVSLNRQEIRNEDLSKSVVFWREQQIVWDKSEDGELLKARAGVYADTPANRKKGIVGQKYGAEKKEVPLKRQVTAAQYGGREDELAGEIGKLRLKLMNKYPQKQAGENWEKQAIEAKDPDMKRLQSLYERYESVKKNKTSDQSKGKKDSREEEEIVVKMNSLISEINAMNRFKERRNFISKVDLQRKTRLEKQYQKLDDQLKSEFGESYKEYWKRHDNN